MGVRRVTRRSWPWPSWTGVLSPSWRPCRAAQTRSTGVETIQNLDSDMIATITFAADTQPLPLASAVTTPASEETGPHADTASFRILDC